MLTDCIFMEGIQDEVDKVCGLGRAVSGGLDDVGRASRESLKRSISWRKQDTDLDLAKGG